MDLFLSRISHRSMSKTRISSLRLPVVRSRMWNVYVKRAIARKDFTAAAHTCLNYIDGFHPRERMPSENVPSADFRVRAVSAFASPRHEHATQKPGLNARHDNFSTISRSRLRDLRFAKRSKIFSSREKFSRDVRRSKSQF